MSDKKSSYDERLGEVRKRFVGSLHERLDTIAEETRKPDDASARETQLEKVHRLLHDLVGNAAMLELHDVQNEIQPALTLVESRHEHDAPLSHDDLAQIDKALAAGRLVATNLERQYTA
ncbi:Hpt domain-containing protein [Paracoccus sp. 1_MG-2023]|uniref:Hpt domain-containing protein n=1 Tax=unclassified Paracoccus (in: a-proteobacteria) TaxID=2688777 RepID=UPI001C0955AA|nr:MULTISPECIES: Hpt domain-containing protein [unclassified Paracoccus (in: a-proteobacteria)]MBU2959182.1 Hpt domain-containing protein [Paracoccus sp. C2R09]MDO6670081.1 Hpt domain-containing protein [Paracoccus sp. 1_MG-2023]